MISKASALKESRPSNIPLIVPICSCWLLMLVTFSAPGRESPSGLGSLDWIGAAKFASRGGVALLLGLALCRIEERARKALWYLMPFSLFVVWALLSVLWSPSKSISLGQAGGLAILVMLAAVVARSARGPTDTSALWRHLSLGMLAVSTTVLLVAVIDYDSSGLDRFGDGGIVHATNAAATASLGITSLFLCRLLWTWGWIRKWFWPGLIIHSAVLLLSCNRTAMVAAVLTLILAALCVADRRWFARACVLVSLVGIGYLFLDPTLTDANKAAASFTEFVKRDQTSVDLSSLSGRTRLWELLWRSYRESPWTGHGYFVCTRTGVLDVWGGVIRPTAHNMWLQVLVSTGLIGLSLFAWSLFRPIASLLQHSPAGYSRQIRIHTLLLSTWYLLWSLLSESIAGPLQPECVVFFSMLGLSIASLVDQRTVTN